MTMIYNKCQTCITIPKASMLYDMRLYNELHFSKQKQQNTPQGMNQKEKLYSFSIPL